MSEPQVWVLIGVFGTAMFGVLGLIVPLNNRNTQSLIDGLRGELKGEINSLRSEVTGEINSLRSEMNSRFETVNSRFESVDLKLEHLGRDVSYLMRREFGATD